MSTIKKRIVAAIFAFFWSIALFWVGGFDFDRGILSAYFMLCVTVITGLAAAFPFSDAGRKE